MSWVRWVRCTTIEYPIAISAEDIVATFRLILENRVGKQRVFTESMPEEVGLDGAAYAVGAGDRERIADLVVDAVRSHVHLVIRKWLADLQLATRGRARYGSPKIGTLLLFTQTI
jgi:hypothetical protein